MPEYHIVRLDQMTQAVNTFASVETNADGSTGGAVRVPQGVTAIKAIRAGLALSADTGTDSGGVVTLRLTGNGLKDGEQQLILGGITNLAMGTAATGIATVDAPRTLAVNIAVIPGNDVSLSAAINGVDPGTPELGVELIFG